VALLALARKVLYRSTVEKATCPALDRRPDLSDLVRLTEERVMLVLSRKLGQSFHVGPEIRVTIVKIDRSSVRIGIEAPGDVAVQREEILFELPQALRLEADAA